MRRHLGVQITATKGNGIRPAIEHNRCIKSRFVFMGVFRSGVFEPHFQRRPVVAEGGPEHIAEHAKRQFRILAPIADTRIKYAVAEPQNAVILNQPKAGLFLMRREKCLHIAQAGGQGRRTDGGISQHTQLLRLKMPAKLQTDIVIMCLSGRRFEHFAVLRQIDFGNWAVEFFLHNSGITENPIQTSAISFENLCRAIGSG
nr:hypothetical protein [Roseovarius aestuarii]